MNSDAQWLVVLRRYFLASLFGHTLWELFQLPLYTIWTDGSVHQIAVAVVHCIAGDMSIAASTLVLPLIILGQGWPRKHSTYFWVASCAVFLGVVYTIYSEWMNVSVRANWAYSPLMPVLPPLGTGLSPLLQWILVPAAAFLWAKPTSRM